MDWEGLRVGFDVFQFVATCAVGLYAFVATKQRATRKRLEELRDDHGERLGCHAQRLTRLESELPHLPTSDAIAELSLRVAEQNGDLKALTAEVRGVKDVGDVLRRQVELIDSWLKRADK